VRGYRLVPSLDLGWPRIGPDDEKIANQPAARRRAENPEPQKYLPVRPVTGLDQGQKPGKPGDAAGARGNVVATRTALDWRSTQRIVPEGARCTAAAMARTI
jgi:hypothetical protein